jgi:hypothetical protein
MFWRRHRFSDQLSAYIDNQLSPRQRERLETHLATCEACRRRLDELRATVGALGALPLEEAPRSFALSPGQVEPRPKPAAVAGLAIPLRLASAGLAFALAVVLVVDLAGVGVGDEAGEGFRSEVQLTPAASGAERGAPAGDETLQGPLNLDMEPTPAAPGAADLSEGEGIEAPAALPLEEGGGIDPLRASEIALAAALGTVVLGWGGLRLLAILRKEHVSS